MIRIFVASVFCILVLNFANCANISQVKNKNIENKSNESIVESEDELRISQKQDKEISQSVKNFETGRQTLSEDFQDIVEAFKGVYKFYDSFSIRDNDKPAAKNKPDGKKVDKKKKQKSKKPANESEVTEIEGDEVTEKSKPDKNKNKNEKTKKEKPQSEKKPKDDKKDKKKNAAQKKKPVKTKESSDVAPSLSMSQLFQREMKKLWTQLSKFVQENLNSYFEDE